MKPSNEQTKERRPRPEEATLKYNRLLKLGLSSFASGFHGERPARLKRSDGRQHPGAHPNGLQLVPQKVMLDSVIDLLEVHKAGIQWALGNASCVDDHEVAQAFEEVMNWRLSAHCLSMLQARMVLCLHSYVQSGGSARLQSAHPGPGQCWSAAGQSAIRMQPSRLADP